MVSERGKQIIKTFEALRLVAYLDSGGKPTIGYGTIRYPSGRPVKLGDKCNLQQAEEYFRHDLEKFEDAVDNLVKANITQNQYDMIVCIVYNIGIEAFKTSTLRKVINIDPNSISVRTQWMRWVHDNKEFVPGLEKRRIKELTYYFS